jgi:putative endonuclease
MMRWFYRLGDRVRQRARGRQWEPHMALGRKGEDVAHRYLQRHGMLIVGRNWRTLSGSGELDLIARDGDVLVFVEVKSRATDAVAAPDRAIDQEKLHRMRRAAASYLQRSKHDPAMVRCDLVSIVFDAAIRVIHVRDAFRLW